MSFVVVGIFCNFQWKNWFLHVVVVYRSFYLYACDLGCLDLWCCVCSRNRNSLPCDVCGFSAPGCADCSRIRLFSGCSSASLVFPFRNLISGVQARTGPHAELIFFPPLKSSWVAAF
jgi:hypothetical protein